MKLDPKQERDAVVDALLMVSTEKGYRLMYNIDPMPDTQDNILASDLAGAIEKHTEFTIKRVL